MSMSTNDYLHDDVDAFIQGLDDTEALSAAFKIVYSFYADILEANGGVVHISFSDLPGEHAGKVTEDLSDALLEMSRHLFLMNETSDGYRIYGPLAHFAGYVIDSAGNVEAISFYIQPPGAVTEHRIMVSGALIDEK